jgi:murein L,D-transpeptidase YafK
LVLPLRNARIVVWKAQRRLELFDGNNLIKTYRVALGSQPTGHKQRQGDGRTPEGQYFICTRNAQTSAFHIFLGLSYPALPDATRGIQNRAITAREYQVIRQRLASRSAPLWRTRLGGWVGIHGGSDANFAQRTTRKRGSNDWTAGCIALTNAEIREIYAATKMGTPVLVKP